ncbi:MAG: flagellar basal-body rod protein FlgF [Alphaproteobacteria bacterium]|jgi:flagellar basal-body rod protein FlgF|nr:flagellar basal-body rod protein FlgF [Alphaproteobacteria bacterium]
MENALLVGLSAQIALRRNMDIIANNLANVSTTGFKRETPMFEELLAGIEADTGSMREVSFVRDWGVLRDMTSGPLLQTGSAFDVAVEGDGMLVVRTERGERYTRDGHMKINAQGQIVTADGSPVVGDGGPITVPPNTTDIKIAQDGTISAGADVIGRFRLVAFPPGALHKEGKNLYSADVPPDQPKNARVLQGMIERSNVEPVVEMTQMIEVMRAYQHSTETLNATDELMRKALQKLGDVKV